MDTTVEVTVEVPDGTVLVVVEVMTLVTVCCHCPVSMFHNSRVVFNKTKGAIIR